MRVLVTGAAGGIGSSIAQTLESVGHTVLRHDMRGEVDLSGDLTDAAHLATLREAVIDRGVDAVFAAHGIAAGRDLASVDRAYSDRVMHINTISFLRLYDSVHDVLTERDGSFGAISSQAGLYGEPNNGAYAASKFALVGWARGIVASGPGPGIRILCPGATVTPLLKEAFEGMAASEGITYEELLARRSARVPAGRLGQPEDLGAAATWLVEVPAPRLIIAAVTGGEVLW